MPKTNKTKLILTGVLAGAILITSVGSRLFFAIQSPIYSQTLQSYQLAKQAERNINKNIQDMQDLINTFSSDQITYEKYQQNPNLISDWLSNYRTTYDNLVKAKDTDYQLLLDYQTQLDVYNNSGEAPADNITVAFKADGLKQNLEALIFELDSSMTSNLTNVEAYNKYFKAKAKLEADFEEYTKKWQADPNTDLKTTWTDIINTYKNDDFTLVGFPPEVVKNMNTKEDLMKVINAYDAGTAEVYQKVENYSAYLIGLYNGWAESKTAFNSAVDEFNASTGNSVSVNYSYDRLASNATAILTVDESIEANVKFLREFSELYYEGENVYDFLHDNKVVQYVFMQANGPSEIGDIAAEVPFVAQAVNFPSIELVEVYEPLSSESSELTVPNTGGYKTVY